MTYRVNPLFSAVAPPPIAEAWSRSAGRTFPDDKLLIDLAQAEPSYSPAPELMQHLAEIIHRPESSRYTPIQGTPELRSAFAADLTNFYGANVTAAEVSITAGCNQSFCLALMALAGSGDARAQAVMDMDDTERLGVINHKEVCDRGLVHQTERLAGERIRTDCFSAAGHHVRSTQL